jgi:hypothetical protein
MTATTRRQEALALAEEVLGDIELQRIASLDIARKASRLARLLDDEDAARWLRYETGPYPEPLDDDALPAAFRSGRTTIGEDGKGRAWTVGLGELDLRLTEGSARLRGLSSAAAASGQYAYMIERDRSQERNALLKVLAEERSILDRVVSALHEYAASRYQELRFGSAVETSFEVVRAKVDGAIASLVPEALPMLSAAFENAVSDNPEDWANAASTCRRLLREVADALSPAGPAKKVGDKSILMGPENYVNRLVDWIQGHSTSATRAAMTVADLEYLGDRLDAADGAGHKGAHSKVDRYDASRFIAGTYLLLGDVLRLTHPVSSADKSGMTAI